MSAIVNSFAQAMRLAVEMFDRGARRINEDEEILSLVQNGDCVVVGYGAVAQHLRAELRRRGLNQRPGFYGVTVVVDDGKQPLPEHRELAASRRPTTVDHSWVANRLQVAIDREIKAIEAELDHVNGVPLGLPRWPQRPKPRPVAEDRRPSSAGDFIVHDPRSR